jgi:Zn-dependent peptidase ImmA (M78 family)
MFESGELDPTVAQLRTMSDKYRRPLIVLLLDEVPTSFTPLNDFRRLPDSGQRPLSPELRDEIRRAIQQQEVLQELAVLLEDELAEATLPAKTSDPIALANDIRKAVGINLDLQATWTDPRSAFVGWRERIESLDVLVVEASNVSLGEMRGFSMSQNLPFIVALNGADSDRGKSFTLIHELCHLILRQPGLCDLDAFGPDIEVFCNEVAGEVLVPRTRLLELMTVDAHRLGKRWSDQELESIQRVFGGASTEVILRRLLKLGLATRSEYEERRQEWLEIYEEFRKQRNSNSKGGPPPHRMQIRDRGRPFVQTIFNAYGEGAINLSELTTLAGVRTKHLEAMQIEAFR